MQISGFLPGLNPADYNASIADLKAQAKTLKLRGAAFIQGVKLHKAAVLAQLGKSRTNTSSSSTGNGCPHCGATDLQVQTGSESWGICTLHGVRWQTQGTATGFSNSATDSPEADTQTLYLADLYQDVTPA
ncbi:MAG: hypothetical protein ACO4AI_01635 [Prochlorothrix sp.]|nr:hypothetical protein [Prochlorothrix sp.]